MLVEINTEVLKKFGITADDFLYLYLLHAEASYVGKELDIKPDLEDLQTKGLIKLGDKPSEHVVRHEFLTIVEDDFDRMWSELVSHFPLKVLANDRGLRMLRARDANAKTNQKSKRAYEKYVGTDKTKHDYVMQCLKNELVHRKLANSLGYMQQLQTWVNNHTWEKYDTIDNDKATKRSSRITRKL